MEALPQWTVTEGHTCYIDRHGCFESESFAMQRVEGPCWSYPELCTVEMSAEWEGTLDVVDASFEDGSSMYYEDAFGLLEVNGQPFVFLSVDDVSRAGVQGMMASTFRWSKPGYGCTGVKICPMPSTKLPGPWGEEPWTCTASGDSCTLPFELDGLNFTASTQQFSDPNDADQDGSLHNGHPQCQSAAGLSLCGLCSCGAGEEQIYILSRVYPHTELVGLVTCVPCEAGRFKSSGGSDSPDSCESCPPGTSSPSGATACANCLPGLFSDYEIPECATCQPGFFGDASGMIASQECSIGTHTSSAQQTACTNCLPGMFKGYDIVECASCQPGYFGSVSGLTMCPQCADGNYSSTEGRTACDACPEGSILTAQDVGCQQCPSGTYRNSSMTSCSPCAAGRFQNTSGESRCYQCSTVLDAEGPNMHLWTTMSRTENMEWQEISGSQSGTDCGCAVGAWVDG